MKSVLVFLKRYKVSLLLFFILFVGGFLRFYNISENPPGLYFDEASIGVNAYSIQTSGRDEHGQVYPLFFKAFGEYKLPVYIYLTTLSMEVFGKNEFAIRFPSAFFGTLTILCVFFLIRELSTQKKTQRLLSDIALIGAGVLAILPWHIHFSRGGFEMTVGLFLYIVGTFYGIRYLKKRAVVSAIVMLVTFVCSMYTYNTYRLIVPITLMLGSLAFFKIHGTKQFRVPVSLLVCFILLSVPLILFSFSPEGYARINQTSAFSSRAGTNMVEALLTNSAIFLQNYLSYFSLTFLFHIGDHINRHQVPEFGLLYLWQLLPMLVGFYFLTKTKNRLLKWVTLGILFISPIPASFVLPSPHSLRFLLGSIPYTMLTAIGIYYLYSLKKRWSLILLIVLSFVTILESFYYVNAYFVHYPKISLFDWGAKCKEVAKVIQKDYATYYVVVDKKLGCDPLYFTFYIPSTHIEYETKYQRDPAMPSSIKVLYIKPRQTVQSSSSAIPLQTIYLTNIEHDIFAQFFAL